MITGINSEDRLVQRRLPSIWRKHSAGKASTHTTTRPSDLKARWGAHRKEKSSWCVICERPLRG